MKIPLVNLSRQYAELAQFITPAILNVIEANAFIQGPFVDQFEREFSVVAGTTDAIGCSSGTSAISLTLEALGVGPGNEVITVAHTFAATAGAIRHVGATPVFVDIEPRAYTVDVGSVANAITPRTSAIVPVHLYGVPCEMDKLLSLANSHGIPIVEDAAQAHGAMYSEKPVGSFGVAATYSFYPGKNLGAYGDAGAVTTSDNVLAAAIRKLRDHGRSGKYLHDVVGYNHRMDGIQGAILSAKLPHLGKWNSRRRDVARYYDSQFRAKGFKTIEAPRNSQPVYHLYVAEVSNRDEVQRAFADAQIATGVHYPVPLHKQPAYSQWAGKELTNTDQAASRLISLPICGSISDDEVNEISKLFLSVAQP